MIERRLVSRPVSTIGTLIAPRVTQQEGPPIVTEGLVLHLDAGNPYSYPGTGTTWSDLSKTSNGTLTNGPTFSTENYGAILFDGTNDYVTVPHVSSFVTTNIYTMECVYYWNGVNALQGVFGKRAGTPSRQMQFYVSNSNVTGAGNSILHFVDGGAGVTASVSWEMPSAGIYHAQVVRTLTEMRLTVNGQFRAENGTDISSTYSTNAPFIVGNRGGDFLFPFSNKVYLCLYYTRALSDAELFQNYQATRWRFGI